MALAEAGHGVAVIPSAQRADRYALRIQAYRLEKLSRYETHLDRKFERTLAMLIKLKDLRSSRAA